MNRQPVQPTRRGVLGACAACLGAGALAACGGAETPGGTSAPTGGGSASGTGTGAGAGAGAGVRVPVANVPVGGSIFVKDDNLIVTQPQEGTFKAFDATCTHQQCAVSETEGGKLHCPCHQSNYDMSTGAPVSGPAPAPLTALTAALDGDAVVVTR